MTFAHHAVRLDQWSRLNTLLDVVDNEVILVELSSDMFRAGGFFKETNVLDVFSVEVDETQFGKLGNPCGQPRWIVGGSDLPCPTQNAVWLNKSSEIEVLCRKSGADA